VYWNSENRRHSWIGHTVRHNKFVVNILEGAISRKKAVGRPRLHLLKLTINNQKVPYANTAKYLGITLDAKLRWKAHVKKKREELDLRYKKSIG
jgi:hypothetical protein